MNVEIPHVIDYNSLRLLSPIPIKANYNTDVSLITVYD